MFIMLLETFFWWVVNEWWAVDVRVGTVGWAATAGREGARPGEHRNGDEA